MHILPFDEKPQTPEKPDKPDKPEPDKPEPPPKPWPNPADRGSSADQARRGEDQLNQTPTPDPRRSSRVAGDYMRAGDPAGAERVLDRLISSGGGDANAYRLRSGARFQKEDWAGAYSDANAALAINPDDKIAADLAGTSRMQLQRLGLDAPEVKPAHVGEHGPDEAGRNAGGGTGATGIAVDPAGSDPVPLLGGVSKEADPRRAFFEAMNRKIAIGGHQEALLDLTRYLDRNPDDAAALEKRAYLLNRAKNPKAAQLDADKALLRAPNDPAALREKAYALIQLGQPQEAMGYLEKAVRLQPGNALGYLYRAMARDAVGEREAALADYKRADALDPALRAYYDAALAAREGGTKKSAGIEPKRRVRLVAGLVALPLLLLGLWNGARHYSGRTTRGGETPADQTPAAEGTLADGGMLGGIYRVGRVLGRGGMGVVFEAWDMGLERKVAIKQLRAPEGEPADYERFLREARLVARLEHPNIVQIHTLVEENSLLYLVFELVEGRGLDSVLAEKGRLAPEEALKAVRGVCAALDCAHEARIIHRDLKPSNIMQTAKGGYKVMDFGIAHQARSDGMLTHTGAWGTPPYMAPEQESGIVSRESDLYALGCTAYELLSGVRPFASAVEKVTGSFTPVTALAPGLAPAVDAFMVRALAPDPAKRFHTGAEFAAAFESCLRGRIAV